MNDHPPNKPSKIKVEMFKFPNFLKDKLGMQAKNIDEGHIDPKALKEAEKIILELCESCETTIAEHLKQLGTLWNQMKDMPQSQEREDIAEQIFTHAHEIKDIGSMCEYNLTAYFAESLRDYINQTELSFKAQRIIIQAHLDALNVITKQGLKDETSKEAEELKAMVKIAIEKYSNKTQ